MSRITTEEVRELSANLNEHNWKSWEDERLYLCGVIMNLCGHIEALSQEVGDIKTKLYLLEANT